MKIESVTALPIFDSRGNPTLETHVRTSSGVVGRGLVPSGASTGQFEAHELRDGGTRFRGKGVFRAIENVQGDLARAVRGLMVDDQARIDQALIDADGTAGKTRLGANAILGVSLAVADAAAQEKKLPLFRSLGGESLIPIPEIQILGGGAHAEFSTDIQDYLVIANGARDIFECLEMTFGVYHAMGDLLRAQGKLCGVADEGGYFPSVKTNEEALSLVVQAIEKAGYRPGVDLSLALDVAASDLYDPESQTYSLKLEDRRLSREQWGEMMGSWCDNYPLISVEDPFADVDRESWRTFVSRHGGSVQVIGDDLFTTHPGRIVDGVEEQLANAVLIKLNQIGTLTETLRSIALTQKAGWRPVVSARSGETEDTFISHLAVATGSGQLKVGSFARSERMAKWNELLRIEAELGDEAEFRGFICG